jgi:putative DNA primase/helicase
MSYQYAEQFRQAIADSGLTPPDHLVADGILYRFSETGESWKKNGWYVFFPDGLGGVYGCWSKDINEHWRANIGRKWTDSEEAAHRAKFEEAKRQRDAEKQRMQLAAKERAAKDWESAAPADPANEYLQRKGIQPNGVREWLDEKGRAHLRIPMFADGELWSIQTIYNFGGKNFATDGRKRGCYYPIGDTEGAEVVCIAEGFSTAATVYEATGYPTYCAFDAGNLLPVGQAVLSMHPDAKIIIAGDDDWAKEGNAGKAKATEAGVAIGAKVVFPAFGADREDGDTDFNDMARVTGLDSVRAVFADDVSAAEQEAEPQDEPPSDSSGAGNANAPKEPVKLSKAARDALLERLVSLSGLDYEQEREKAARELGVRTAALDAEVKKFRKEADNTSGILFDEVEPWGESVPFGELLDNISGTIQRFIVCDKGTADTAALWVVMTWVMDIVQVAPLAVITAPEKRCGKSQMLNVMGKMVYRPLQASNIKPAVLYRLIEIAQPALMLDETDTFMREDEELRGIINSGHTRDSAFVFRCVGDDHVPTRFSTWGAKALSGIGKLADTLMDRAVILQLRRKLPHEKVDRLRYAEPQLFADLVAQIKRCVDDNREAIRLCRPDLPAKLNDRAQDNWEPLLAIADVAGGGWSERARAAALHLSDESEAVLPVGTELLHDIRDAFLGEAVTKLTTVDLIKALCKDTEKRWATHNRGKEITPTQLAKRLSEYGIKSKNLRFGSVTGQKGFEFDQFKDTFARYLDGAENVACSGSEENVAATDFQPATIKPAPDKDCSGVAAEGGVGAGDRVVVSV